MDQDLSKRLLTPSEEPEDTIIPESLRPQTLHTFIGQKESENQNGDLYRSG